MTVPDLDTLFGDVRSTLDGPPSPERWDALCALLADVPDSQSFSERLAPYLRERLTPWPDAMRRAPVGWLRQDRLRAHGHLLSLCRHVSLTRGNLTHKGLKRILGAWGEEPITRLDLEDCRNIKSDGAVAIAESHHASSIRHLNLNLCGVRAEGFVAFAAMSAELDHVDLSYNSAPRDALGPWIRAGSLALARVVLLNHCNLTSTDVLDLCTLLVRGRITTLELRGSELTLPHAQRLAALPWAESPLVTLDLGLLDAPPRAVELLRSTPSLKGKLHI